MRHCVFGASTKCVDAVAAAEKAMEKLITSWMVEEDCAECRFHSSFVCVKGELKVGDTVLYYHVSKVGDTIHIGCHTFKKKYLLEYGKQMFNE